MGDDHERRPLEENPDAGLAYLSAAGVSERRGDILLEYVPNDDPRQFLADAATLTDWVRRLQAGETHDGAES